MKHLVSIAITVVLHLVLGWQYSVIGGMIAGFWVLQRGWLAGMIAVGTGWLILLGYNLSVATDEIFELFRVTGVLLGGLPPITLPLATVLTGCLLGAVAGSIGRAIGSLRKEPVVVEID